MTKQEYMRFHEEACRKMMAITRAKNADYTGQSDDPFANFSNSIAIAGVPVEQGFLVRIGDKLARIRSFIQKGVLEVKDESVEDTLLDLANYAILLAGYIKTKKHAALPVQPRMFTDDDPTRPISPGLEARLSDGSTRAANARAP